jgi:ABC-type glycerol-3-phosphate transport system substrate-binding protein
MKIKFGLLKKISLVLSILILATLTSGCGLTSSSNSTPKVLTIWGFDDPDVWKPLINNVSQTLTNYKINYVQKPLDGNYEVSSLNSMMSGEGPDVWAIPSDWVLRHLDQIAPMPDAQAKTVNLDEQFVPVIKQNGFFNGKIYSLSPTVDTLAIYYNPVLFDQALEEINANPSISDDAKKTATGLLSGDPPLTWTNLVDTSKFVTKKSGSTIQRSGIALGTSNNVSRATDILYALMLQNNTKMTSDNIDTATFNLPTQGNPAPGKASLDFFRSFSDPHSPNYSWNSSMPNDVEAFATGKTAMIVGYDSLANTFMQKYPDFKYNKFPFPQLTNEAAGIKDYAQYITFVVPKLSLYPAAAWQLIGMLSGDLSSDYATSLRLTTSTQKTDFVANIQDRGGDTLSSTQAQTATTWAKGRFPSSVNQVFSELIQGVANGTGDTKSALDLASTKVTDLFRKTTW